MAKSSRPSNRHGFAMVDAGDSRHLVVAWGGDTGVQEDVWQFDTKDKVWEQLDVAGPAPRASAGVAFAMLDKGSSKLLVLFGGVRESETADMYTNETACMDMASKTWLTIGSVVGDVPTARVNSTLTAISPSKAILFGGASQMHQYLGDVYELSVEDASPPFQRTVNLRWTRVQTTGNLPNPREGHSAVWWPKSNALVVFGGIEQPLARLNNTYLLDLDKKTWSQAQVKGVSPSERCYHTAFVYQEGRMIVFGGWIMEDAEPETIGREEKAFPNSSSRHSCSVYSLDLDGMEWHVLANERNFAMRRAGHCSVLLNDTMYSWGGRPYSNASTFVRTLRDMSEFSLAASHEQTTADKEQTQEPQELAVSTPKSSKSKPQTPILAASDPEESFVKPSDGQHTLEIVGVGEKEFIVRWIARSNDGTPHDWDKQGRLCLEVTQARNKNYFIGLVEINGKIEKAEALPVEELQKGLHLVGYFGNFGDFVFARKPSLVYACRLVFFAANGTRLILVDRTAMSSKLVLAESAGSVNSPPIATSSQAEDAPVAKSPREASLQRPSSASPPMADSSSLSARKRSADALDMSQSPLTDSRSVRQRRPSAFETPVMTTRSRNSPPADQTATSSRRKPRHPKESVATIAESVHSTRTQTIIVGDEGPLKRKSPEVDDASPNARKELSPEGIYLGLRFDCLDIKLNAWYHARIISMDSLTMPTQVTINYDGYQSTYDEVISIGELCAQRGRPYSKATETTKTKFTKSEAEWAAILDGARRTIEARDDVVKQGFRRSHRLA